MIVPGSANPLLMAQGGDPLDDLSKIERSVRFRDSALASFYRVFPAAGNRTKWTARALIKRSKLSALQFILGVDQGGGNYDRLAYQAGNAMEYNNGATGGQAAITSRLFRDPAAWCDVVLNYDSGNPVQADRAIITLDGIRQATPTNTFALNQQSTINASGVNHAIGGFYALGGYLAHFCFIDNAVVPASFFGQFHPRTGQWRPKTKAAIRANVATLGGSRNGWGVTGFFLPFDDVTSLTTLGYDRSQSDTDTTGNNWTATNISLTPGATYDSMLDTPTSNFCTLNPLIPYSSLPTFADGNLKFTGGQTAMQTAFGTMAMRTGKWYWEVLKGSANINVGIGTSKASPNNFIGFDAFGYSYISNGTKLTNNSAVAYGATSTTNDIISVLFDADAGSLSFWKNGVDQGVAFSGLAATDYFPAIADGSSGAVENATINFGQRPFSYSPPSDYKALCTKNLPIKPAGPIKASSAFVAVTAAGASIASTLAAARAGWPGYIDIIKRRDAAEGWRWMFGDDPGYYLDSSGTAVKAAVPAFGGASYVGYALKVAAANGIATGRLTHVNGVADVVVDGLANSQKIVMLRDEAGGNWFFYHPDLTAGKLLYMNSTAGETTDASINGVTTSGFTVAAALASGTYRWISLAEVEGFLKLFKHIGNASVDGPFSNCGYLPGLFVLKNKDAAQTWLEWDGARDTENPQVRQIYPNQTASELLDSVNNLCDFVSQGIKYRGASAPGNGSGNTIVGLSISAFPFRYANAR